MKQSFRSRLLKSFFRISGFLGVLSLSLLYPKSGSAAVYDVPTPAQYSAKFKRLAKDKYPAWSMAAYFKELSMVAKVQRNHDEYYQVLIDSAFTMTKATASKTKKKDTVTGAMPNTLLDTKYSCGKPTAFLVHHGAIWTEVVSGINEYLISTRDDGKISENRVKIYQIIKTATDGLNFFRRQIKVIDGLKTYTSPVSTNSCPQLDQDGGQILPINMSAAAGDLSLSLLDFYAQDRAILNLIQPVFVRLKGDLVSMATDNFQVALNSIKPYIVTKSDGNIVWDYRPRGPKVKGQKQIATRPEDTSHAVAGINFLIKSYRKGKIPKSTLTGLTKTFHRQFNGSPTKVLSYLHSASDKKDVLVSGEPKYVQGLSRWIELAEFDCTIYTKVKQIQSYTNGSDHPYATPLVDFALTYYRTLKCR